MKSDRPKKSAKKPVAARKAPSAKPTRPPQAKPAAAKVTAAKTEVAKTAAVKKVARKARIPVPAILLEGDYSPAPPVSGPGSRYVLQPAASAGIAPQSIAAGELPDAYGTKRLLLTARDPHWLYAHWDLTRRQLQDYNKLSRDRHLVLRIYQDEIRGKPFNETAVHPESRNWFVHVGLGGTKFLAELGYYPRSGKWVRISTSAATLTPPDKMSDDFSVNLETLPVEVRLEDLVNLVKAVVSENVPLVEAIQQLRITGFPGLPEPQALYKREWTPTQEAALAKIISMDSVRRVWMGSLEITEVIRRQLQQEMWSAAAAQFGQAALSSGALPGISSPRGGEQPARGFWFSVNAELIVYGATEPSAQVTIGGRPIKLRPDGTFSYRFALPDGQYQLPAVATSADQVEQRAATLAFSRSTEYRGPVAAHPQDAALKPPSAENVS